VIPGLLSIDKRWRRPESSAIPMPARHVALLRGVNNVGRSTRVAMADLRALFESLGFRDVRTLLNSGNVVFSCSAKKRDPLCGRIEKALSSKLGLASSVTVLSADEVATIVRENPFREVATNPSHLLVVVPQSPSDLARLAPLLAQRWTPEMLAVGGRAAYLWCAKGLAKSPLWMAVERALARSCTGRNIATMTKLMAACEQS
jgi:uncharacterized protein (DUF1697 family)